jgi:hypothetical protein
MLLLGLWTPVAGVLVAVAEVGLVFLHGSDPWMHILLGTIGAALAMLDLEHGPSMRACSDGSASTFHNSRESGRYLPPNLLA